LKRQRNSALLNLGHELPRGTIAEILKRKGVEPAPERDRKTTWKEFLTQHWEQIVAADFFTVEVWTGKALRPFMVLFVIELSTRRVQIAGISAGANGSWMIARLDHVGHFSFWILRVAEDRFSWEALCIALRGRKSRRRLCTQKDREMEQE
jgi:hypothetical protein